LPVIISDNEQFKDIMDKYKVGLAFKAQDADSLRETIGRFIDLSLEQRQMFKDNCKRFNQDYSMDRWAKNCLLAYERLF
jgi:glycogen synthase